MITIVSHINVPLRIGRDAIRGGKTRANGYGIIGVHRNFLNGIIAVIGYIYVSKTINRNTNRVAKARADTGDCAADRRNF